MTTWRQIGANRRNAEKSTGPRTEAGKRRSRRNALRHGLCAETVVEILEDIEDYKAFEIAIASEYDAQSVVERELILRLASLLWRIRRATGIETALLELRARQVRARLSTLENVDASESRRRVDLNVLQTPGARPFADEYGDDPSDSASGEHEDLASLSHRSSMRELAHSFEALADGDQRMFERLGRYEAALCRQVLRTLFALQSARRRFSPTLANTLRDIE